MLLRKFVRLVLPSRIRRPLADRVYGLIACLRNYSFAAEQRLPSTRLRSANRILLAGGAVVRVASAHMWARLAAHRYLLGTCPEKLTHPDRLRRHAVRIAIILPDRAYRRVFAKLQKELAALPEIKFSRCHDGVTFVIGTLGPGGAERQAVMTVAGLVKRGHGPVRVICSTLQSEASRFFLPHLEKQDVHVTDLKAAPQECDADLKKISSVVARLLPASLRDVEHYICELARERSSIVHLWLDEVNIKGGIAAVALGIPRIILGLRSLPPCNFALHQPYMREAYRWLAKQPGVVLVNNSNAGARAYEEWLGLKSGAIHVIHNGFDFDLTYLRRCRASSEEYRRTHNIPIAAPLVGTVIRFTEEKRPFLWLQIAAEIRKRHADVRFLIVGDGPLRSDLEQRADKDDLRGMVTFTGHETNAMAAMAAMDIFLLTSRAEGLPNVLVEAQAIGVPVVTTNVGGAPETLEHNVTGWILENDDSRHAADIIVKLLRNDAWREEARLVMPEFVSQAFGMERMLDETIRLYDKELRTIIIKEAGA